ncbi:MAG: PQQ-dependent sugar dehydrogenase [Rhodobacteraceae bacterium]|nr:PQQ-dependent sugar dehydrogenase [Paracoccaceae bacterium]
MRNLICTCLALFFATTSLFPVQGALAAGDQANQDILQNIRLQKGFRISVFAEVPLARSMVRDHQTGIIYVGSRGGIIHAVIDRDLDGVADGVRQISSALHVPNGIAIKGRYLYIALQDRVAKWELPDSFETLKPIQKLETITTGFHDDPHHGWRYAGFGPDGLLYVSLGAPCNICALKYNTGKIIRINTETEGWEIVANGVRNSVGFDWHPRTGELWFTDNGADLMGDDTPPDELNRMAEPGDHFGFPFMGGFNTPLAGYEGAKSPVPLVLAAMEMQAHSANLGIDFYSGRQFPPHYQNNAFIAQHGSWNRTEPVGYRIMRIRFNDAGFPVGKEVFAEGWLQPDGVYGRPVDLEELPDGSLLVSDDHAGLIYRISYDLN